MFLRFLPILKRDSWCDSDTRWEEGNPEKDEQWQQQLLCRRWWSVCGSETDSSREWDERISEEDGAKKKERGWLSFRWWWTWIISLWLSMSRIRIPRETPGVTSSWPKKNRSRDFKTWQVICTDFLLIRKRSQAVILQEMRGQLLKIQLKLQD